MQHCESEHFLTVNDYNLLVEVKEYLEQDEIKWSISNSHIKLLCELSLIILLKYIQQLIKPN
jgi:hypothetical protein